MTTIKEHILKEIDELPEESLEDLDRLIHSYRIAIKKQFGNEAIPSEVLQWRGLLPDGIDWRDEYFEYLRQKHS